MGKIRAAGKIVSCVMVVFLLTEVFSTEVAAGECDQLVAELSQLKSLIKRKSFLDEAVKSCVNDYRVIYYYAYNFERRRKYDRALHYYKYAVKLNPDYARSYFGLGDTYLALRNNKEAVAALEKGLQLDPGNIWAEKSLKKAKYGLHMQPSNHFVAVDKKHEVAGSFPAVSAPGKEDTAPQATPAGQPLQSDAAVTPEKTIEEDVPAAVPLSSAIPEAVIPVKPAGNALEEEKDITVRDFIDRMQVDADTVLGAQDLVMRMQIQFNPSSGDFTPQAMVQLDSVVCRALHSDELEESKFEVAGHTDSTGSFELNMHISRERAHAVKKYLIESCGIESDRLSVVYYGETRPHLPNTSLKNRRLNRRVEFRRVIDLDKI